MYFRYDNLIVGYPWNATYVTQHNLTGVTFEPWGGYYSYIVVNFTSDGSKNKRGFFIRFHSGIY